MRLNREELALGGVFGLLLAPLIGAWAVLLGAITAFLWALGGSGRGRAWRFLGVPGASLIFMMLSNIYFLDAFKAMAWASFILTWGYGVPDLPTVPNPDRGSTLGRLVHGALKAIHDDVERQIVSNIVVRGLYALFLCLGPYFFLPRIATFFALIIPIHILCVMFIDGEITI